MYQGLSLLTGIMIAIMVVINGKLTGVYGVLTATVIIHIIGTAFAGIVLGVRRRRLHLGSEIPLWCFLGGAIGVLTTVFNNIGYGKISMTGIVALGLLGQTVSALMIDSFGLLGVKKQKFQKTSIVCLACAAVGMFIMLRNSGGAEVFAIVVSLAAGITVVLNRIINAGLSEHTGALESSFVNHLVGIPTSCLFLFAMGRTELTGLGITSMSSSGALNPLIYIGGIFGVAVVLLCNITVPKLSVFKLTLTTFVGQVFTGIVIDLLLGNGYSKETFFGGIVIAAGVIASQILENITANVS